MPFSGSTKPESEQPPGEHRVPPLTAYPVVIHLFGCFRVLKLGHPIGFPYGGKAESLLRILALRPRHSIARDVLQDLLWPDKGSVMAGQSLNSLVHVLQNVFGEVLRGSKPVLHLNGVYHLNVEAGVGVDVSMFDALAALGDQCLRRSDSHHALHHYSHAVELYEGDLDGGSDVDSIVQRERLRARYMTLLLRLADLHYAEHDYRSALSRAELLLLRDPYREDAHRMAMRCYVKLGERAQALRQYRLCEQFLHTEFNALPEQATTNLFDQVRLRPEDI